MSTPPVGPIVEGWTPRAWPEPVTLEGRFVRLEPLRSEHAATMTADALAAPDDWSYLGPGPFTEAQAFSAVVALQAAAKDAQFFAVIDKMTGEAKGYLSLMRIDTANGVIEIGNIWYGRSLQRRPAGTEAVFLLAAYVFDQLGYRRFEWKCNDLNAPSRRAAERLGFIYEGTFRQHMIIKGRNRDTAWYAMTDQDWCTVKPAFEAWLDPDNVTADGSQRRRLADIRAVA
ncbi:Protein N-acetyltransferase, RimJ/RimL family [Arboricoccus pini]|uniref:Protein N-acetyltransferase, RimJ/RimL family n=1 Tax=Arboricoccus pini TaxID=1963835 RepID=A0A212QYK6_9PROT|nr:GNAT family protein [Arboricoccus pini]SNB64817.1 Protein N-acetyltransferase, RimJ/RimL family [Arboricoccus pini]